MISKRCILFSSLADALGVRLCGFAPGPVFSDRAAAHPFRFWLNGATHNKGHAGDFTAPGVLPLVAGVLPKRQLAR